MTPLASEEERGEARRSKPGNVTTQLSRGRAARLDILRNSEVDSSIQNNTIGHHHPYQTCRSHNILVFWSLQILKGVSYTPNSKPETHLLTSLFNLTIARGALPNIPNEDFVMTDHRSLLLAQLQQPRAELPQLRHVHLPPVLQRHDALLQLTDLGVPLGDD